MEGSQKEVTQCRTVTQLLHSEIIALQPVIEIGIRLLKLLVHVYWNRNQNQRFLKLCITGADSNYMLITRIVLPNADNAVIINSLY